MLEKDYRKLLAEKPSELLKIVDIDMLRGLLQDFTTATGLTANVITTEGKSIFSRKDAQNMCKFCRLVRKLERKRGLHRCVDSYARAGKQASKYREACIFRCPAGLVEWVSPIMLEDVHIGSIVCGQVLMWEPEEFFWIELEQFNRELTDDLGPLMDAAHELQVVTADKVQAASKLLGLLGNSIVNLVWERIRFEDEKKYQKTLLAEEQGMREELERKLNVYSISYYYEQTQSLAKAAAEREFGKARSIFKVIMADIMNRDQGFRYASTQLYDLVFLCSHIAVDLGADPEKCMHVMVDYCDARRYVNTLEGLGRAAEDTAERIFTIMENTHAVHKPAVDAMCSYITSHLGVNFSLKDVADVVDLSPYYASRIFKEDMGLTIMEYATKARMNEAKHLLSNPRYRVEEIAAQLGYSDSSYFGRVFKKSVGMSPRQYRMRH